MYHLEGKVVYLSVQEIADLYGISKQAVMIWKIEHVKMKGRAKLYDLPTVVRYRESMIERKAGLSLEQERAKLAIEQTEKAKLEVEKLQQDVALYDTKLTAEREREKVEKKRADTALKIQELKYKEARGELISVDRVRQIWTDKFSTFKSNILNIPRAIAPEMLVLDDVFSIEKKISEKLRDCLDELSQVDI